MKIGKNGIVIVIWTRNASAVFVPDLSSVPHLNKTEKSKK